MSQKIQNNMQLIQTIFLDAMEKGLSDISLVALNEILVKTTNEYISVAYEAAAMGIALKSLETNNSISLWEDFYTSYGNKHGAQLHVGLGWAISQLNIPIHPIIKDLNPMFKYRVVDGYSYRDGRFKRRQAVRMKLIPEELNKQEIRAYNQGIGRSLWYIVQGDVERLNKMVNSFSPERHFDVWRGVGIGATYVGGIDINTLNLLTKAASSNLIAFKCGVAIAAQTRKKAQSFSESGEMICVAILDKSIDEIGGILQKIETETEANPEFIYYDWIKNIEKFCVSSSL